MSREPKQMSEGWWDPVLYLRQPSGPRQQPPQAAENGQQSETVLYGPRGEALIRREPRRVGFRKP